MINPSCFYSREHVGALEHWSFVPASQLSITGIILVDLNKKEAIARLGSEKNACARGCFSPEGDKFYYGQGPYGDEKEHRGYDLNKVMEYDFKSNRDRVIAVAGEFEGVSSINPVLISDKDILYVLVCTESSLFLNTIQIIWSLAILNLESKQLQFIVRNFWPYSEVREIGSLLAHAGGLEGIGQNLLVTDLQTGETKVVEQNIYLGKFLVKGGEAFYTQKLKQAVWLASTNLRSRKSEKLLCLEQVCSPQDICGKQIIMLEHSDPDEWSAGSLAVYRVGERHYSKLPLSGLFSHPRFSTDGRNVYALQDGSGLVRINIRTRKIETILDLAKEQPVET